MVRGKREEKGSGERTEMEREESEEGKKIDEDSDEDGDEDGDEEREEKEPSMPVIRGAAGGSCHIYVVFIPEGLILCQL